MAAYGASETWRNTIVPLVSEEDYRWSSPSGFVIAALVFMILNPPVWAVAATLVDFLQRLLPTSPVAEAIILLVTCTFLSGAWWWLIAAGVRFLSMRRRGGDGPVESAGAAVVPPMLTNDCDSTSLRNEQDHSGSGEIVMQTTVDIPGLQLEPVATTSDEVVFSVVVDGHDLGTVAFAKYHVRGAAWLDPYVALWAGPTLCVIDRQHRTLRCFDRDDETHRVHPFERTWVVEGELNIDLFDPKSGTTLATYGHNEVITDTSVADGLVHLTDFAGATVTLDPRRSLRVTGRGTTTT